MAQETMNVIVIGAGLGGLSAAIALAQQGYHVEIHEKNEKIGGKLNVLTEAGYTFDMGPSILTLPHIFERLFEASGKKMADYIPIRALRPHWRNFFEDGSHIDISSDMDQMAVEMDRLGEPFENLERFLQYSKDLYDIVDAGYFQAGLDTVGDFQRFYGLDQFARFDLLRTMHQGVARRIRHPRLRDIFDFFIKYVGSSAYRAPAFMNCLPAIQFEYDLWYVDGGLYNIARGLERLMEDLDITTHLQSEVVRIVTQGGKATGIETAGGETFSADIVVSNMEVIPAYEQLLEEDAAFMKSLAKFEPACSGLVLDLGLDVEYPQLAHHNFFFSGNQREHFRTVFQKRELPTDPTIYLVAASKTDPTVAPEGCDCLKILPHIPYINDEDPLSKDDYLAFKERIVDKLERMGLTDLRKHTVFEHVWTPLDIRAQYNSNKGSIYGVVSDRFKNLAFKAPKQSTRYPNLFFAGGSVNPGGGMPMVVQCGQNVARSVAAWDRE